MIRPTDEEIADLTRAVWNAYGGCACHGSPFGPVTCPGHRFITEVDKRSVPIHRWERLLFVRTMRARFEAQEFGAPPQTPVDTNILPW